VAQEFDYVIVGGGSAGCALAGRLTENPKISVCLLEAGPSGNTMIVKAPIGIAVLLPGRTHNWAFESVPQPGLNGRKSYQPRGKSLGGSSSINAMVYIRGHRWDYDHWASLGCTGWGFDDVLPYFKRSENNETIADGFHGKDGPLNVANLRSDNPFQQYFLDAGRLLQMPTTADFNGDSQEGLGPYQVTQKNGERWSAARAYVEPHLATRKNLQVITGAQAKRIMFEGKRAVGVEVTRAGVTGTIKARAEVIASTGALQTPQLLMLSGIGDGKHLSDHGLAVVHDNPNVGQNLQDHIDFGFAFKSANKELFGMSPGFLARMAFREIPKYRKHGRGMVTSNVAEAGGFLKTDPSLAIPDIQLHFSIGQADDHGRKRSTGHGFGLKTCLLRPKSRGSVTLNGADASLPPRIDPKFYDHPDDLEVMVKGYKIARRIVDAEPLAKWRTEDKYTAHVKSDDDIREVLRDRSDTVYHPVGTARMGTNAGAVVNPQLRVNGVENLRVVDASIMPTLIGGNTNAPAMMIGEKAADMIKAGWVA
jgi:choline dehydrogenase-like flavoprotein